MLTNVSRSIEEPIRKGLSLGELWSGSDRGLICCWERGREKRVLDPELASRAEAGELIVLAWSGGVDSKLKKEAKHGSLNYLATWQGLRNEDLDINRKVDRILVCTKTGQSVTYSDNFLQMQVTDNG